jgi:hypothetical protein
MEQERRPRYKQVFGFKAQYKRILYALEIAQRPEGNLEQKEYEFITFFMHCWHLKDHIKHDDAFSNDKRDRIVKAAENCPDLKICQALANGLKHYVDKTEAQMIGNASVTVVVGSHIENIPRVELADGTRKDAIDIAKSCVKAWEIILKQEKIEIV